MDYFILKRPSGQVRKLRRASLINVCPNMASELDYSAKADLTDTTLCSLPSTAKTLGGSGLFESWTFEQVRQ